MPALVIAFLVAVTAGVLLTPLIIRMAVAWDIYDAPPGGRRVHTEPLPRVGGVSVFLSMGLGLLVAGAASWGGLISLDEPPEFVFGVLFGATIVFAAGLIDDLRGLRPSSKFLAQCVAAFVVYANGFRVESLAFGANAQVELGVLALPLTLLWIVGVTNAFNLIDGLDGLATGIALVALGTTLVIAIALGNLAVVVVCVALLGALVGFFRYNFNPARIFLGDSGSLFVGFMLAVLSVHGAMRGGSVVLALVPLFALAIPLLDTALAILRRWLRGVPLSRADGRHVHHRLLALGLSHRHAVVVLHFAAVVLAVFGLSLVFAPPATIVSVAAAGGGATLFIILYGLRRLQYHEFAQAGAVLVSGLTRVRRVIRDQIHAQDLAEIVCLATTVDEISAVLEDNAPTFGFLHMEICRESSAGPRPLVLFNGHAARAWKLDYPVSPHDFVGGDDIVLRIWCNPQIGLRLYGAERVAQILAPVIEEKLHRLGLHPGDTRVRSVLGGDSQVEMGEVIPTLATEGQMLPRLAKRLPSRAIET